MRKKSIKYLPVVIETEKNVFNTPTGQHELRKTIENVIVHLNDGSDLVQKEAEKVFLLQIFTPFSPSKTSLFLLEFTFSLSPPLVPLDPMEMLQYI